MERLQKLQHYMSKIYRPLIVLCSGAFGWIEGNAVWHTWLTVKAPFLALGAVGESRVILQILTFTIPISIVFLIVGLALHYGLKRRFTFKSLTNFLILSILSGPIFTAQFAVGAYITSYPLLQNTSAILLTLILGIVLFKKLLDSYMLFRTSEA